MSRIRLGLLAAWPVYYQAPLYRLVAADPRIDFTAVFASSAGVRPFDRGFDQPVVWDDDVLSGYRSVFLRAADRRSPGGFSSLRDLDVVPLVARSDFDMLWTHGYNTITHLLAIAAQRASGRAVLVREEQTLLRPRSVARRAVKAPLLRALFSQVSAASIGIENRRWFERYGVPPERIFHAPYAADNAKLRTEAAALAPQRAHHRRLLGVDDDRPIVLSVGRFIEEKQPLALLGAFARLRREQDCALVLVGSGPLEAELRRRVASNKIPDVLFAGFRLPREMPSAYVAADVFVQFSRSETWGYTLNEALNFALPVVVSDRVGAASDLVRQGVNGYVVAHEDVSGLSDALGSLVSSRDRRRAYGTRSLEIVEPYSYKRAAEGIVSATRAAVGERRWSNAGHEVRAAT